MLFPRRKWKDIEGYEGLYQVSNLGEIKSLNYNRTGQEKLLKPATNKAGYQYVGLWKNGKTKFLQVHRLVASVFIENLNNYPEVNHKDENPSNNYVENLEWCTRSYNNNYGNHKRKLSESHKGLQAGEKNPMYGRTGEKNPMYGKRHTEEAKNKMSEAKTGKFTGSNNPRARKVQASTGEIFNTVKEASKWCNLKGESIIHQINSRQKTAGKHPITGEKLT